MHTAATSFLPLCLFVQLSQKLWSKSVRWKASITDNWGAKRHSFIQLDIFSSFSEIPSRDSWHRSHVTNEYVLRPAAANAGCWGIKIPKLGLLKAAATAGFHWQTCSCLLLISTAGHMRQKLLMWLQDYDWSRHILEVNVHVIFYYVSMAFQCVPVALNTLSLRN